MPPGFGDRRSSNALLFVTLAGAEGDKGGGRKVRVCFISPILRPTRRRLVKLVTKNHAGLPEPPVWLSGVAAGRTGPAVFAARPPGAVRLCGSGIEAGTGANRDARGWLTGSCLRSGPRYGCSRLSSTASTSRRQSRRLVGLAGLMSRQRAGVVGRPHRHLDWSSGALLIAGPRGFYYDLPVPSREARARWNGAAPLRECSDWQ